VPISAGYRPTELPGIYDVDGIFAASVQIVKHGPVNCCGRRQRHRDFYIQMMGFEVTEEVVYRGQLCVFLKSIPSIIRWRCSHARCATRSG